MKLFSGHLETIQNVHDLGADIRSEDENQRTALHWAAINGSWLHFKWNELKSYLVTHLNNVFLGHLDIVKYLVEHGAYLNVGDSDKNTPLYLASLMRNCSEFANMY